MSLSPIKQNIMWRHTMIAKIWMTLIDWAQDFENWQNESGLYDSMATSLLVPYFINDTSTHDVVWLNIWPSPTAQYAGLENWLTNGGEAARDSYP